MSNLSPKYTPTTYGEAHDILNNKDEMRLCYETSLTNGVGDGPTIRHHRTHIVTFHRDGSITLNGAGWVSRTTADRMRRFTPANVRVSSRKNDLTVTVNDVVVGSAVYGLTIVP